jgi:topoisomerase-4 subunit A
VKEVAKPSPVSAPKVIDLVEVAEKEPAQLGLFS